MRVNRQLLGSPLYRTLFRVVTPQRIVRLSQMAWARFHQGSTLTCERATSTEALFTFAYPAFLFSPVIVRAFATATVAGLRVGGHESAALGEVAYGAERAQVEIRIS